MLRTRFLFMVALFCLSTVAYAQLPYEFTNTARNAHYGVAYCVTVSSDGTVFLAEVTLSSPTSAIRVDSSTLYVNAYEE